MKTIKTKLLAFLSLLFFGVASLVYSDSEWNLSKLSKADPDAKAWIVQVEGDSLMIRSDRKKHKVAPQIPKGKRNRTQDFSNPYAIYEGDVLATGVDDRATILLRDGSVIWIDSITVFKVSELNVPSVVPGQSAENYKVKLKLRVGGLRVRVPKVRTVQKKFSVQTPKGTASVRGTEQIVNYSPDAGLRVQVLSGLVQIRDLASGTQYATRGEKVSVNTNTVLGATGQTVNEQKRMEVDKSVKIASGDPFQVQDADINNNLNSIVSLPNSIPQLTPSGAGEDLTNISAELRSTVIALLNNAKFIREITASSPYVIDNLRGVLRNDIGEIMSFKEWIIGGFGSTENYIKAEKAYYNIK